jgi:hypothetical protein
MRKGIKKIFRKIEICAKLVAFFAEKFSLLNAGCWIIDTTDSKST